MTPPPRDQVAGAPAPVLDRPARARLVEDLLAWGRPRPAVPDGLVDDLRARLEAGLAGLGDGLEPAAAGARGGRLAVTPAGLRRLACDGLRRDPLWREHTRGSARGVLTHRAIEQDWDGAREGPATEVAAAVWRAEASRRPGDPRSLSAWLNRQPPADAADLRAEVADLLDGYREVWPPLPAGSVRPRVERPVRLPVAGGRVLLRGVPDLVLDSPVRDGRARSLVVTHRTGPPGTDATVAEPRFHALLVALADGRPPFRWATFYVTEGRAEVEDLSAQPLHDTVDLVLADVAQQVRLAASPDDDGLVIRGGAWCAACARQPTCDHAVRDPAGAHPHDPR